MEKEWKRKEGLLDPENCRGVQFTPGKSVRTGVRKSISKILCFQGLDGNFIDSRVSVFVFVYVFGKTIPVRVLVI